jgi:hypothetical protein
MLCLSRQSIKLKFDVLGFLYSTQIIAKKECEDPVISEISSPLGIVSKRGAKRGAKIPRTKEPES